MDSKGTLRSNLYLFTKLLLAVALGCAIGHFLMIDLKGYQSPQLTSISEPIFDALAATDGEYLDCMYKGFVRVKIHNEIEQIEVASPADFCPFENNLHITKDRQANIAATKQTLPFDFSPMESELKQMTLAERREQFAHLAQSIRDLSSQIRRRQDSLAQYAREDAEHARLAKPTWQ